MTIRLTVHRGTKEIGGSCIELATHTTRIILDLGLPLFDRERQPIDSNRLRSVPLEQLLLDGWISPIPGLFSNGPAIDAIFLSHAHEDHAGLISHTRPDIPVDASRGTSKMMLAGSIFARQPRLPRERFRQLLPEKSVSIGDLEIMGIPVDHSVFGAMAFLVRTQGKTILYSEIFEPTAENGGCMPDGSNSLDDNRSTSS